MADPRGFLKHGRKTPTRRPVPVRVHDWSEVYELFPEGALTDQAARCMDCGIPFCHTGCPLGNLIPDWNDLVYRRDWAEAVDRLHATNNFPDFTGRLCPAPCEASCVLGINDDPVAIKQVELEISEWGFTSGYLQPVLPTRTTGKTVTVVGSGPAGLAVAQQLTRAGHSVTVFERADRVGGLLRYGIPEFKMEKRFLDRRLDQMVAEGTRFVTGVEVGVDVPADRVRKECDALVLAGGATQWRDLPIPGRELDGIHQAMEFLPFGNRVCEGDIAEHPFSAHRRQVVIIGGGDTGADCLGTVHRQDCAGVVQLEILPRPPDTRDASTPWPLWPLMYRTSSAHEEGGERVFSVNTERFVGDENGRVRALGLHEVRPSPEGGFAKVPGTEFEIEADMVLLALGFTGPTRSAMLDQLGVDLDQRTNVARDRDWMTNVEGVFVCGDMGRGQSLIVWAIAEGRAAAAAADRYLMGLTHLPTPVTPDAVAMR